MLLVQFHSTCQTWFSGQHSKSIFICLWRRLLIYLLWVIHTFRILLMYVENMCSRICVEPDNHPSKKAKPSDIQKHNLHRRCWTTGIQMNPHHQSSTHWMIEWFDGAMHVWHRGWLCIQWMHWRVGVCFTRCSCLWDWTGEHKAWQVRFSCDALGQLILGYQILLLLIWIACCGYLARLWKIWT